MTDEEDALELLAERNTDGGFDELIASIQAGKFRAGVLRFTDQRGLELLTTNNLLGRFDAVIAQCERVMSEPVVYVLPI